MKRLRTRSIAIPIALGSMGAFGQSNEGERLYDSARVVEEILDIPDGIPQELLDKAECIVVLPSVKKFALGIGGSYGKGAMVCRGGQDFSLPWGAPAMYRLEGGNIGLQLGGQATDFLLLVMNSKGVRALLKSNVKLGADASVAAGPKGRATGAATDASMHAEILTYSRSRGLFAGISLEGSTLRPDDGANRKLYGRKISAKEIVLESKVGTPKAGQGLVALLERSSPENLSN
ncbi:MAG TPA: lipid-binding SYLF domain-containing protein [Vicinamibacteria bacterium]|nr:lipid-binding SYLF domain-containing protein [Vicinamibacteria bacterium]